MNGRMTEERFDEMLSDTEQEHLHVHGRIEFYFVGMPFLCGHGLLQVVVQVLVRVELGAVGRKEYEFDAMAVLFQPLFDGLTVVHSQIIDDEYDLTLPELNELPEELQKSFRVDRLLQRHPLHFSLVVDGADEARMEAFGRLAHDRSDSFGRKASSKMAFRLDGRFVAPPDLRSFGFRLALHSWVDLFHPLFHLSRALLVSFLQWSLGSEAPASQDHAHRLKAILYFKSIFDQLSHGLTGPKSETQLQLIRSLIGDELLNLLLLIRSHLASTSILPTPLALTDSCPTPSLKTFPPSVHCGLGYTEIASHLRLGFSFFQGANRLAAHLLLGILTQRAGISIFHQ